MESSSTSPPGTPRAHETDHVWSNIECLKIALEGFFPSAVEDIGIQKRIIDRFLRFYLGLKSQKGLSVPDLVYAAIAIMPLHTKTDDFLWERIHYRDDGALFVLTPEDKVKTDTPEAASDPTSLASALNDLDLEDHEIPKVPNDEIVDDDYSPRNVPNGNDAEVMGSQKNTDSNDNTSRITMPNERSDEKSAEPETVPPKSDTAKPSAEHKPSASEPKLPTDIRWYGKRKQVTSTVENKRIDYGPVENAAFTSSCNKLLKNWESDAAGRKVLKYFCGVVALTLLRATTKTYMHLVNTFASQKFRNNLTLQFVTSHLSYSPPHKRCVKSSYRIFKRREDNVRVMFAKLVVNSFMIDKKISNNEIGKLNVLKLTVLSHTSDYGLGIVNLLQAILNGRNSSINLLYQVTCVEETSESWGRLINYLNRYMASTSTECTHHWARIIDSNYFRDLSCASNYALAVILAVFSEKLNDDTGIWKSTWVGKDNDCKLLRERGILMYEEFKRKEMSVLFNLNNIR